MYLHGWLQSEERKCICWSNNANGWRCVARGHLLCPRALYAAKNQSSTYIFGITNWVARTYNTLPATTNCVECSFCRWMPPYYTHFELLWCSIQKLPFSNKTSSYFALFYLLFEVNINNTLKRKHTWPPLNAISWVRCVFFYHSTTISAFAFF